MNKKLSWFCRISIGMVLVFILANILVKVTIWTTALKQAQQEYQYAITKSTGALSIKYRYTTELKQKLFNEVDYLLTPAFTTLFVVIAVRLVKTPEIFKEED